jgi:general secretion pathway protein G
VNGIRHPINSVCAERAAADPRACLPGLGCIRNGFTLIEVVTVAAILGILAALAVPSYLAFREKARFQAAVADMKNIETSLYAYQSAKGEFPDALAEVAMERLRDPWGRPYAYLPITESNRNDARKDGREHPLNTDFDLYSVGRDGKTNKNFNNAHSRDDIVRARNGAYVGLASNYH